ncbi:MAG TPA: methyl-accepting chemotaxis protein [Rhodocyclaceae bacterium]|nr:methyl-accepting chemotaxis protein [Rhodocyclaceae bacterium]
MKMLFAPAEALMNRFGYPFKFGMLGAIVFLAFATLMVTLAGQLNTTIERSRSELVASALSRPLSKVVEFTQQHRGLSAAVLGGGTNMAERRRGRESDIDVALAELGRALSDDWRASRAWQELEAGWSTIKREGMSWRQGENFDAHTAFIAKLLRFQTQLADAYGLTFDPEPETYYLKAGAIDRMPFLLERIGQLRARGSGVLARASLDEQSKVAIVVLADEIKTAMGDLEDNLAKVIAQRPELKAQLDVSAAALNAKLKDISKVVSDIVFLGALQNISASQFFDLTTETIGIGYAQMYDVLLPTLDDLLGQRIARAERVLYTNVAILLAVLVAIGYLSVGAYLSVMTSIRSLREGSHKLATGDLTTHIELAAHDELRFVAGSFNEMSDAMRGLIGGIKRNSDHVADSARQLVSSSAQIDAASQRQSDAASSMAAAVEQMTVGIENIARNAGEADGLARRSGDLSREGGEIVASVVKEIGEIAASVASSARTVEALGERSGQISAIVGVIGEIAAQTNLLALNAAIEAARAGEQGRGFAVVADEVRKLAERTANSTKEISEMVHAIQQGTQGAVEGMEEGVARVNEGVARAERAGEAMQRIREAAAQVVSTVTEISGALREQSAASTEIARQVETIARMAEENGAAAGSNHQTANRLGELADTLLQNVSRFRAN